jgi:hypothetical protein
VAPETFAGQIGGEGNSGVADNPGVGPFNHHKRVYQDLSQAERR